MRGGRASAVALWATIAILAAGCDAPTGAVPTGAAPSAPGVVASPSASGAVASPSASLPAATGAAVSILEVECTTTGTRIGGDTVAAQPDGVHFRIRNTSGESLEFEVDGVGGDGAPAVEAIAVWLIAPGPARIRCQPLDGTVDANWTSFTVADPAGVYVADRVTCATSSTGIVDYAATAHGEQGDPVDIARRHLRGLRPGDVVEAAGYPATDVRKVRLVRGADVIVVVTFEPAQDGGWLRSMIDTCSDAGVTWGS